MSNRTRVFSDVLAIDAWHEPFRMDGLTSSVHVEVSFHEGRIGGDDETFPFTFRVRLKRALLTIMTESPLRIDRNTIARFEPLEDRLPEKVSEAESVQEHSGSYQGPRRAEMFRREPVLNGDAIMAPAPPRTNPPWMIQATPFPRGPNEYSWQLSPIVGKTLIGQPWDPVSNPRFSVKSLLSRSVVDPSIKVILSCKLEDIDIDCLEPKDSSIITSIKGAVWPRLNVAVAIQQLKNTLRDAQLAFGAMTDGFSDIVVADILAVEN